MSALASPGWSASVVSGAGGVGELGAELGLGLGLGPGAGGDVGVGIDGVGAPPRHRGAEKITSWDQFGEKRTP